MPKIVVSDTSCFIALRNIDQLQLLEQLYGKVYTTEVVVAEFGEDLPSWVEVVSPNDHAKVELLELQIDKGEASAITLAVELDADVVILDDYKARKIAESLQLGITGTIGIFLRAKEQGLVSSVKALLDQLATTNFRLSSSLIDEALMLANEVN